MSGFNIIQLNVEKINKDDYINCMSTIDDSLIESHTDYVDDDVNDDERLKSVKYSVAPFATVNRARRTLTFKKRETVIAYYLNVIESAFEQHRKDIRDGLGYPYWRLRMLIDGVNDDIVWYGCGQRMLDVIADYINGDIPRVMHIGAIMRGHF